MSNPLRIYCARYLAVCGWQMNTAFVERLNLSLRQRVAAMRRRSATPCKSDNGLDQQLTLFQVYHNFVCLTPVCAKRWLSPFRPMTMAQPSCGDPVRQRWRRD